LLANFGYGIYKIFFVAQVLFMITVV